MNLRTAFPALSLLGLLYQAALPAQNTVAYTGVGGRFEQQIGAIQRNAALPASTSSPSALLQGSSSVTRLVFVRFLADTDRDVTGFDLRMHFVFVPEVVAAYLYTADAANRPASRVASGLVGIETSMQWCRASFRDKYRVQGGQLYYLAFELPPLENVRLERAESTSSDTALNVTYLLNANGAFQSTPLKFRVNTNGFAPKIVLEQPRLGQDYRIRCEQVAIGQPAGYYFTMYPSGLPISLRLANAPGSFYYLDPYTTLFGRLALPEADRDREFLEHMPNLPHLIGQPLYLQWIVNINSSQFSTSDMASCVLF